jgi:hypothetical protein
MPASGRAQRTIAGKRHVIADAPENHLRGHALVDSVEELLNETRASFGDHELERAATLELAFRGTKPMPRALRIPEYLLSECRKTSETHGAI